MKSSPVLLILAAAAFCLTPDARAQAVATTPDAAPATETVSPNAATPLPTKIYVASYGNDANNGSRANPKRNLQAAHNAVAAKGDILVLDTGSFGALHITKSVAVTVPSGITGLISVTGQNKGVTINSGAGSLVTLRGLTIEGGGSRQSPADGSSFGIYVTSVGSLSVEDCTIRNFLDAVPFQPANPNARLIIHNSSVRNCRLGVDVQALTQPSTTYAAIRGCRLEDNNDAISTSGPGQPFVSVENTVLFNCTTGVHMDNGLADMSNCKMNDVASVRAGSGGTLVSFGNNALSLTSGSFDAKVDLE